MKDEWATSGPLIRPPHPLHTQPSDAPHAKADIKAATPSMLFEGIRRDCAHKAHVAVLDTPEPKANADHPTQTGALQRSSA
mmetsp:Transcript_50876/g.85000  ORF Transcript_50876/g.85000 Transcript_50876/m.85000 type:complete len:81 (+) Transcript_50876:177-419(+)